jgi:hypothetical protein
MGSPVSWWWIPAEFFKAVEVNHAIVITQFQSVGFSWSFSGVVIAPLVVEDFRTPLYCTEPSSMTRISFVSNWVVMPLS